MSNNTVPRLTEEIAELQDKLAQAKLSLRQAKLESPEKQLAVILHDLLCNWNHTDGCGWFYEFKNKIPQWDSYAHADYLEKAERLIARCHRENIAPERAIEIYRLLEAL